MSSTGVTQPGVLPVAAVKASNATKKQPYPLWLGGVAASIAGACTHPLDLTKVRLQVAGDKGMLKSMKRTVGAEGLRGLYDGLTGTLLRQMTYSMMRFAVYDKAKATLHTQPGPVPVGTLVLAGTIAGSLAAGICNPGEIIMVRMQGDKSKPVEKRFNYRNSIQGLARMLREEGIASWYKGVGPNIARGIAMNASQLGSYDLFKGEILKTKYLNDGPILHFVASFMAATTAAVACAPADVIKSRIMSAQGGEGVFSLISQLMKTDGPKGFFKGLLPAWLRLQPTTIITFLVLEQLKNGVDYTRARGITLL